MREGMSMRSCLLFALCVPCAAPLAWGCDTTGPVLGDTPAPPSRDASTLDAQSDRDAGVDAWCPGDLSNVGTGDFHIGCTVTTTQTGRVALANQRSWCYFQVMWDLRMEGGVPVIEIDDEAGVNHYTKLWSVNQPIDDGQAHDVLLERVSGTLSIKIDGVQTASTAATESLGPLPPLVVDSDICIGVDGTGVLTPPLANLCVGKQ
jgi:Laminin G domain